MVDRIQQGGLIGYIILILATCGFIYALFLLAQRLSMQAKMNAQLTTPDEADTDNPLGRVLKVYENEVSAKDLETLEMKLDEAVLNPPDNSKQTFKGQGDSDESSIQCERKQISETTI